MLSNSLRIAALALLVTFPAGAPAPALAQSCEGTVHGLSRNYNPSTGAGFLAVRSRPTASSRKLGELFNGDKMEIFGRRGNWYEIASYSGLEGWAHARWIHNDCGY